MVVARSSGVAELVQVGLRLQESRIGCRQLGGRVRELAAQRINGYYPGRIAMIHKVVEASSKSAASAGCDKEIIERAAIQVAQDFPNR